jgi:predicted DNA binding CopG/RHH family protein
MKKRSVAKKGRRRKARDLQVAEFERRDRGDDLRATGAGRVIRPRARPTSILLDEDLVVALRKKGAKRGLGYQTMLKVIVREHLDEY